MKALGFLHFHTSSDSVLKRDAQNEFYLLFMTDNHKRTDHYLKITFHNL